MSAMQVNKYYLMVTLGSWVTPQVMTALVPLMTLWSCGGLVMRVRAVKRPRGWCSETTCLNSGFSRA